MLDPLIQEAQDNLARVADCFRSLAQNPEALQRLSQLPSDELEGLRETIKQAHLGLSLISSALDQIARGNATVLQHEDTS